MTNSYSIVKSVPITVNASALMSIDTPTAEAIITSPTFLVAGWSIDRTVEGTALSGAGVDALHLYAYPNPGSGQAPIFLGVASLGIARPDVGAAYGSRMAAAGTSWSSIARRSASRPAPTTSPSIHTPRSAAPSTTSRLCV